VSSVYKRAGLWLCLLAAAGISLWLFALPALASGTGTTISVSLSQSSIAADGTSTTTATATVNDASGTGVTGDSVTFSSSDAGEQVSTTTEGATPGTYTATITSSTTVGTATITATDSTSVPSGSPLTGTATLTQTAGGAATVTVALNPNSIVANGTSTTTATATVKDAQGHLLPSENISWGSSDSGDHFSNQTNAGGGTYTATVTSSTTVGTPTITATDGSASSGATLTQIAGGAATVTVALNPASIIANGTATTVATATVKDAAGHLLPGENISWSSSDTGDKFSGQTDAGNGTYTATVTSSTTVGTPTIKATDGSVSGGATLTQTAGPAATVTLALNPTSIIANGTATTVATATVKDAQGHLLPAETVTFTSSDTGDKASATTNAGSGTYTATITGSTTVGTPTITATDGTVSGTAILTQTAGSAATVQVAVSPAVILANGTSTAGVTATVADAQGHLLTGQSVSFKSTDSGQFFGQVSDNGNGTYSVQVRSSATVGLATITATDSSVSPAVSGQGTLDQAAGPSTTSLVASSSALVTNETVTLFATVNGGAGSPSGAITFNDRGAPIANCVAESITPSNPGATCQTSFAASTSPEQLTAVFTPNSKSTAPGSTGATIVTVTPDSTSVSLHVSATVNVGQSTTYTATVAPPPSRSGPVEPSGSVEFFDAGKPIPSCLNQALVNLSATCTLTYNALGTHSITALYGGDSNFTGSTVAAQPVSVVPVPVPVLGRINATMQWTFAYALRYTKVVTLSVNWVSSDATVLLKCHGRGCPFATHTSRVAKPKQCGKKGKPKCPLGGAINLTAAFKKDPLHPRATIIVMIRRSGWVGKYYKFTIRAANQPVIQISCLAPGRTTRPGVGC
jgi:Bacterial Ig-like domain (group 3)/Invasin, domain 3